ncbi:MAG: hypothetical protein DRI77_06025 [Chloroflexi bacterium]|nr:MAG: hypothetical protein DRI77_06025 [Chloroflexota bacterium]
MNKWLLIVLAVLVACVLLPNTPLHREIPTRDSGVFLYIGQQILDGKIPYRDVWDHKPPVIHYINALGLFIGNGSVWGVSFLEFGALYLAGVLSYIFTKRALGVAPAIFGVIACFVTLTLLLGGGNFTEEFALPCQFAALYLFWQSEQRGDYSWRGFLIGVTAAISFLLKQNLIGVHLSIVTFLLLTRASQRRWHDLFFHLTTIFLGAASIILIVGLYFACQGALNNLWNNVFEYNFAYFITTIGNRTTALVAGLVLTSLSGMSILALVTWFTGVIYMLRDKSEIKDKKALLLLSLVNLPIEFFLVAVSGKAYSHYYIAWLPVFTILTSFFAYVFTVRFYPRLRTASKMARVMSVYLWVFVFMGMIYWPGTTLIKQMVTLSNARQATGHQMAEYIKRSTNASDYVLIWGAETSVNFVACRQSPTRFVYQYPLYTRGYQSVALIKEFLDSIATNKPVLVVDTSPSNELIPPLDPIAREKWSLASENYGILPAMDSVFDYIASNYRLKEKVGQEQWPVYVYVEE